MSSTRKRWIIKNEEGLLKGPYTTEQVLRRISRGALTGDELISEYPGATWYPISKDPHFYDRLLEVLSRQDEGPPPSAPEQISPPANSATSEPVSSSSQPMEGSGSKAAEESSAAHELDVESDEEADTQPFPQSAPRVALEPEIRKPKKKTNKKESPPVIEMTDVNRRAKEEVRRGLWKPMVVALIILGAGVYLLLQEPPPTVVDERIHLLSPQFKAAQTSAQQARQKAERGKAEYVHDTFSGYARAQNELVQAIDADPRNPENMALLCLTYYELWPYAFQDADDLRAISTVTQAVSAVDGAGVNAGTCKVVDLLLKGRFGEARSLSKTILEASTDLPAPYYFMAILSEVSGDIRSGISYLSSAQRLWPQWIRVFVYQAQLFSKMESPTDAARIYRQVLAAQPHHDAAKIELGLLEAKNFRNPDRGIELISSGVNSKEKVPKSILSRGHLGLAEIYLERRNPDEALKQAQKSYSLDSTNTVAKNLVIQLGGKQALSKTRFKSYQLVAEGDQLAREGDCNAAQAHYKTAYEVDSKSGVAAMKAGQCLWSLSLTTEAIEWLNKAVKADPKLIEAYVLLADYYSQRYNFVAAAQVLLSAQQIAPKSYEVYRGYAMVQLRRNDPKGAVDYAKRALAIYDIDVESHVIMAEAQIRLGNYSMAFAHAARAREIDSNHRGAQVAYGKSLVGAKGADAAIDYFRELVKLFPVVSEYRLGLGKVLLQEERFGEAEQVLSDLTHVDEKSKEGFLELGRALRLSGKFEMALAALEKAAILDPSDAEPLFQMGILYLDLNKPADAQVQLQRVVRINKLYPLVHYHLGKAAMMAGDLAAALKEAQEERSINPSYAEPYLLAAEVYSAQQQYGLCVNEYQKAVKVRPQSASIYLNMAVCYRKADQLEIAISMLNQAAVRESGMADIYRELGIIYEVKGDLQEAEKAYSQYFVLNPNAPDRSAIEQRLKNRFFGR